jgi:hypothetical protein
MAHNVTFSIPERELGRADVEFKISNGGSKIGTLKVSKGTVVWLPKDHSYGYKMGWKDFDDLMRERGAREQ